MSDDLTENGPGDCALIELPVFPDVRGTLSFVEGGRHIPFDIKRAFYLYDVPAGGHRAAHALMRSQQYLIAIAGSLDVLVDDGGTTKTYHLHRRNVGLFVPALIWRELLNFSADCVCLVLASEYYDPDEYYDEYAQFREALGDRQA